MLTHRGFSAWIAVDLQPHDNNLEQPPVGRRLTEYLVATDTERNEVSCWITGEVGQKFAIFWEDHGGHGASAGWIKMDGEAFPGRYLFNRGVTFRDSKSSGPNTERPFMFRQVTEDTDGGMSSSSQIGSITLRLALVNLGKSQKADDIRDLPDGPQGDRRVGDPYIGLGEERSPVGQRWSYTWSPDPRDDDPMKDKGHGIPSTYVRFTFRYRSYDWLASQGIAPPLRAPNMRRIVSAPAPSTTSSISRQSSQASVPSSAVSSPRYPVGLSQAGVSLAQRLPNNQPRRTASMAPSIPPSPGHGNPYQHLLVTRPSGPAPPGYSYPTQPPSQPPQGQQYGQQDPYRHYN